MIKLVALYRQPGDERAFLDHYERVHTPLARAIPHLRDFRVSRVTQRYMGEPSYFMVAELTFGDTQSFDEAMSSSENQAAAEDLNGFAADLVTLLAVESE